MVEQYAPNYTASAVSRIVALAIDRYQNSQRKHGLTSKTSEMFRKILNEKGVKPFAIAILGCNQDRAKRNLHNIKNEMIKKTGEVVMTVAFNLFTPLECLIGAGFGRPDLLQKMYLHSVSGENSGMGWDFNEPWISVSENNEDSKSSGGPHADEMFRYDGHGEYG